MRCRDPEYRPQDGAGSAVLQIRSWPAHEGGDSARRTCDRQPRPVPCHQRSGRLPRHGKDRQGRMHLGLQARSNVVIAATTTPIGISMRQRLPARTLARRQGGPGRRGTCPGRCRCRSEHPGLRSPDRTGEGAAGRGAFFLPPYGRDRTAGLLSGVRPTMRRPSGLTCMPNVTQDLILILMSFRAGAHRRPVLRLPVPAAGVAARRRGQVRPSRHGCASGGITGGC